MTVTKHLSTPRAGRREWTALGVLMLPLLLAAVYSRDMADAGAPEAARETLGGAVAVADDTVLAAAHDAFTHAMGYAAAGAAVGMAGAAVLALILLRGTGVTPPPTGGLPQPEAEPAAA